MRTAEDVTSSPPGLGTRVVALTFLVVTAAGLAWLAVSIVRVFTDAWIAPIALSPDSDSVLSLNLDLTRQRGEIGRVEAELTRLDAEIAAIDSGLARLGGLRDRGDNLYRYGAELRGSEVATLRAQIAQLREERAILDRLVERQEAEVGHARTHLEGGLIERRDLDREEQSLDNLRLARVANARALTEADARRRVAQSAASEFRAEIGAPSTQARMPEIAAREESDVRLDVEILRLEAERRGLVALRGVAERSLAELRDVMTQIEARPVFRATREAMNVAFVPYEQLEGVREGSRILECDLGIFNCHQVGTIRSVLPGEVVTQDPWGELARGRYAVLDLVDLTAVEERILRVR